ncbi:hypothetical protein EON63_15790, partial [archaeon]
MSNYSSHSAQQTTHHQHCTHHHIPYTIHHTHTPYIIHHTPHTSYTIHHTSLSLQFDGGMYSLSMICAHNLHLPAMVMRIAQHAHSNNVKLAERAYTTLLQAIGEM